MNFIAYKVRLSIFIFFSFFFGKNSFALESLSYSGRLVQANGAPVTGSVNIRAELAYTNSLSSILCSQEISNVPLTNGVFHLQLNFVCTPAGTTLTQVLSQVPAGQSVAIQITDITNAASPKSYSFQALHAIPFASVASQLLQMSANHNEVLKWDDGLKKWKPGSTTGGTVTSVSVSAPLTISNPATTPSITIPQANSTTNGYLSSADWNAFNSKQGALPSGGDNTHYYRGDNTWQTLNTDAVPEGSKLYFENARVLGVPLTGFTTASGAIVATDTVLDAFGKTQGQINSLVTDSSKYLIKNNTDSITGVVNVGTTGLLQLVYSPVGMNDATNKAYVDTGDALKVNKAGDTMSGVLTLDNDLKIKGGANYVTVKGHASSVAYNLFLPQTAGTAGYVLSTDGSGNTSWVNPSLTVTGTSTVNSASITDGSIVDADVNASAAIAQSKIANLTTDLSNKQPLITAGTTSQYYRGDKTFVDLGTDVRATALTGFAVGANTAVVATDTTLSAFQKVQGQIDATNTAVAGKEPAITSGTTAQYIRGDKTLATFVTDVINSVLGTISPTLARIATADSIQTAFNKTQGQLDAIAAGYVAKNGTNVLTGVNSVQGITARLTVPTPVVTDVTDVANVQFVKDYVDGFGLWSKTGSDIYFNTGKVGIGTNTPTSSLDISNTGGETIVLRDNNNLVTDVAFASYIRAKDSAGTNAWYIGDGSSGAGGTWLLNYQANPIHLATDSTTRMTIDGTGNVGIGITSPASRLEVKSAAVNSNVLNVLNSANTNSLFKVIENSSGNATAFVQDSTGTYSAFFGADSNMPWIGTSSNHDFRVVTNSTEKMRIAAGGNVGIGNSNPTRKLDVLGQGSFETTSAVVLNVKGLGAGYSDAVNGVMTVYSENSAGSGGNVLKVGSAYAPNSFAVKDTGSVGIGTLNPTSKLHVTSATANTTIKVESTAGSGQAEYYSVANGTSWVMGTGAGNMGSTNLGFYNTGNKMVLTTAGNLGIATETPDLPLTVNGSAAVGVDKAVGTLGWGNLLYFRGTENSTDTFYMGKYVFSSDVSALRVNIGDEASDYFIIGSSSGGVFSDRFWVKSDGNGWMAGTLSQASDRRLKKNIVPLNNSLERILSLDGVYYDWISKDVDQSKQIGLIAQEVQKVFPEVVRKNEEGFLSVSYSNLIAPVIESIKEIYNNNIVKLWDGQKRHDRAIASLEEKNKKLNQDNQMLKNENEMIKKYLCQKDKNASFCFKK